MRRKGPPYKVVQGAIGSAPPPHVAAIFKSSITLSGELAAIESGLVSIGLSHCLGKDKHDRPCIEFSSSSLPYEENSELQALFCALNKAGFKFSYDHTTPFSPSAVMTALQELGVLASAFDEIAWTSPGKWHVTSYDVESA